MAKKKTTKVIQKLSPENYIRTKARTLQLYECLVNDDWQEASMASVIVARKHTNGNVTCGFYQVDMLCLGVKDSYYMFNVPEFEYREKLDSFSDYDYELKEIEYNLAHNIIFAAIGFAEDYGFNPHKIFTTVSQFILEEDDENIPLIDIECGKDGKPMVIGGMFDDDQKLERVISQLEREAGPDNYFVETEPDDYYDSLGPNFDDDTLMTEELDSFSLDEKLELFRELYSDFDNLDQYDEHKFATLIKLIANDLSDEKILNIHYNSFFDTLSSLNLAEDFYIDDLMISVEKKDAEEAVSELMEILFSDFNTDYVDLTEAFKKYDGVEEALVALEYVRLLEAGDSSIADERFGKLQNKHVLQSFAKIKQCTNTLISNNTSNELTPFIKPFIFFGKREEIDVLEYVAYVDYLVVYADSCKDISVVTALGNVLFEMGFMDNKWSNQIALLSFFQMMRILEHLGIQEH